MTSSLVSNPVVNSDRSSIRRKKKKKIHGQILGENHNTNNLQNSTENSVIQWKSEARQNSYSSKLLQALRQVRRSSSTLASAPKCGRAVREAAYRVLAASAKGRSRWSRAILTNRLKLKFLKKNNLNKRQRNVMVATTGSSQSQRKSRVSILSLKMKSLPAVQRKTRVLSRLVPGCRKQPLPVILEEATDYIAALEMQVRAMSALAELLSVPGSSSSSNAAASPPGNHQLNQLTSSQSHPSV
ncbi:transcription factor bHLH148-like isoform X1 [Olea europaea var. sylvestris]|uniref:Transcription factor bHLH148-like n=1 Tax=Olea europaea subsp. europaea TaxID=158383 RepID=A0A8S0SY70_OLEEU|nr:transcription factor bHLH148-like isoform X1 [Olea europaea var. sylvestris]XP_022867816.1 transcription factor bHLH148-like isoform X1 [Olea europaea var. sylvestris]XP_022867817.1 transcription factor bHLH148-like isoform X1 [Olea europaea var. sylvestris]XP_022867818.1 transcription factor bHLH148-like isoform X1 [Olea europaea var. sylvestris]CAA2996106.1 transcription factor bHLH148-like [Olea europaea subsp. europaea]